MKPPKNPTTLNVLDALDARTSECAALKTWRADLIRDLGDEKDLPLMARELVEQATRLKLLLDRMDAPYLPKRSEPLAPTRDKRMQIRKMLVDVMARLGMDPAPKTAAAKSAVPSLDAVRARYGKKQRRSS
jgi:hypothetical protein